MKKGEFRHSTKLVALLHEDMLITMNEHGFIPHSKTERYNASTYDRAFLEFVKKETN